MPRGAGPRPVGDTLSLTITRRGKEAGVEKRFVTGLVRRGIVPAVVKDETLTAGLLPASGAPRAGWRTRRCTGGASRRPAGQVRAGSERQRQGGAHASPHPDWLRRGGIIPDGTSIDFITTEKTSSSDLYERLARYCDEQISKAILGQTADFRLGRRQLRTEQDAQRCPARSHRRRLQGAGVHPSARPHPPAVHLQLRRGQAHPLHPLRLRRVRGLDADGDNPRHAHRKGRASDTHELRL